MKKVRVLLHLISQKSTVKKNNNVVQFNRKPKIRSTPGNQS